VKILIDMNLSPQWVSALTQHGFHAVHWSEVGDIRAKDTTIMEWARNHKFILFTHDLDFGVILALTRSTGPSVLQIRTQDPCQAGLNA